MSKIEAISYLVRRRGKNWTKNSIFSRSNIDFNITTRYTVRGRGAKLRTSSDPTTTTRLWSKTTCVRLATYARSRHIAEKYQKVQYQAWFGGYLFLLPSSKKSPKRVQKTGPWTGWYQVLTFLRAVHFWILENQELKTPVDSSSEAAFWSPS